MVFVDPHKPHLEVTCHMDTIGYGNSTVPAFIAVCMKTLSGVQSQFFVQGQDEEAIERLKSSLAMALHHIDRWEQDRKIAEVMDHSHV